VTGTPDRLRARQLAAPAVGALAFALALVYAVGFDQGALATALTDALRDSGGVLHEVFHDARHLLGVPCH
jgi:hypothetical protein